MKNLNVKLLGLTSLLMSSPLLTNASEIKSLTNEAEFNLNTNTSSNDRVSLLSIKKVFSQLTTLRKDERSAIAKDMRNDFQSFMNKYFLLDQNQNKCLETEWKENRDLINIVDILATTIETQGKIGEVSIDEVALNNAPAGRKKHSVSIKGEIKDGSYTVSGSWTMSW